jgi:hypothetical protein
MWPKPLTQVAIDRNAHWPKDWTTGEYRANES